MAAESSSSDESRGLEEFLLAAPWVRALAASLTRNAADADDATQDAWLLALNARADGVRSWRAWFGSVIRRRRARAEFREAHRRAIERTIARPEARPEDRAAEIAEIYEQLTEAVRALPNPYRGVIALRFHDGLSPEEIAERLGAVPGTVRSQISRGLAMIREHLDRRHGGDRSAWLASIGLLVPPQEIVFAGTKVAALAMAFVLFLGTAVWWTLGAEPETEHSRAKARGPSRAENAGKAPVLPVPTVEITPMTVADPSARVPDVDRTRLSVSLEDGTRARNARILVYAGFDAIRETETDERGEIEIVGAPPDAAAMIHAPGHVVRDVLLDGRKSIPVRLSRTAVVIGHARFEDGRPAGDFELAFESDFRDATVLTLPEILDRDRDRDPVARMRRTKTDSGGGFRIEGFAPGNSLRFVGMGEYAVTNQVRAQIGHFLISSGVNDLELVLARVPVLTGKVIDVDHQAPVANAEVDAKWVTDAKDVGAKRVVARTDAAGVFRLSIPRSVVESAHLTIRVQGLKDERTITHPAPGETDIGVVEMRGLESERPVAFVVHDAEGRPIAGARLERGDPSSRDPATDSRGRIVLPAAAIVRTNFVCTAQGFLPRTIRVGEHPDETIDVLLTETNRLTINVRDEDGRRVGRRHVRIEAVRSPFVVEGDDNMTSRPSWRGIAYMPVLSRKGPFGAVLETVRGRSAELWGFDPTCEFKVVLVDRLDRPLSPVEVVRLAPLEHRTIEFQVQKDGVRMVGGLVRTTDGGPAANVKVACRTGESVRGILAETDASGRFVLEGLDFDVADLALEGPGYQKIVMPDVRLPGDGGALDLTIARGSIVTIRAIDPAHRPVAAKVTTQDGDRTLTARRNADGSYRFDALPDRLVDIAIVVAGRTFTATVDPKVGTLEVPVPEVSSVVVDLSETVADVRWYRLVFTPDVPGDVQPFFVDVAATAVQNATIAVDPIFLGDYRLHVETTRERGRDRVFVRASKDTVVRVVRDRPAAARPPRL